MNIVILDDYQDAVRKLQCASKLDPYTAKVYTNTVKGLGQLSVRLKDADVIVLIRERTHLNRQLIEKLPRLKLIAQTGKVGSHIDVAACSERGIAVAEGIGSPVAPAELTWALIMAAMRRLPQYIANLKHGAWQQSGLKSASMPPNFGLGNVLRGKTLGIWGYGKIGQILAGYGRAFGMNVRVWGREASRARALSDGYQAASNRAEFFEQCDIIAGPTNPTVAYGLGEKTADPVQMYLGDIYTVAVNLAGLPALSHPAGFGAGGLPVGLQLIGNYFGEARLLGAAHQFQLATDWHTRAPAVQEA